MRNLRRRFGISGLLLLIGALSCSSHDNPEEQASLDNPEAEAGGDRGGPHGL